MYDVIIIGRSPAGISASLYTARAKMKTLVIYNGWGNLEKAERIQNYYGTETDKSGMEILSNGVKQANSLDIDFAEDEVVGLDAFDGVEVTGVNKTYQSKALIIAVGAPRKKPSFVNLEKFEGNGISFCGACDGFFYRDKKIAVIGYNEYMLYEAIELADITDDITVLTNGLDIDISEDRIRELDGFDSSEDEIIGFYGNENLEGIEYKTGRREGFDGVFIAFGSAGGMEMAMKSGLLTENVKIIVDDYMKTNIPNIFAAGDCTGGFRQIAVAVGEGAAAAKSAIEYVRRMRR